MYSKHDRTSLKCQKSLRIDLNSQDINPITVDIYYWHVGPSWGMWQVSSPGTVRNYVVKSTVVIETKCCIVLEKNSVSSYNSIYQREVLPMHLNKCKTSSGRQHLGK